MSNMQNTNTPMARMKPPARILVRATTDLLPGNDEFEKWEFNQDCICQKHWQCAFTGPELRFATLEDGPTSFFVVDHGDPQSADVPILCYTWNGNDL